MVAMMYRHADEGPPLACRLHNTFLDFYDDDKLPWAVEDIQAKRSVSAPPKVPESEVQPGLGDAGLDRQASGAPCAGTTKGPTSVSAPDEAEPVPADPSSQISWQQGSRPTRRGCDGVRAARQPPANEQSRPWGWPSKPGSEVRLAPSRYSNGSGVPAGAPARPPGMLPKGLALADHLAPPASSPSPMGGFFEAGQKELKSRGDPKDLHLAARLLPARPQFQAIPRADSFNTQVSHLASPAQPPPHVSMPMTASAQQVAADARDSQSGSWPATSGLDGGVGGSPSSLSADSPTLQWMGDAPSKTSKRGRRSNKSKIVNAPVLRANGGGLHVPVASTTSPSSLEAIGDSLANQVESSVEAHQPEDTETVPMTTVMIRHIACRYTQEQVVSFLDEAGLQGKFDFIYLPLNPTKRANLGYVFVNFVLPEYVDLCRELLDGQVFGTSRTEKRCQVALAHVQGAANITRHFHRKAVMRSEHPPLFVGEDNAAEAQSSTSK